MSLLGEILAGAAAAPLAAAVTAYFRYRLTRVREQNKTARLSAALDGATPSERAAIIEACGRLETPRGRPHRDDGENAIVSRVLSGSLRSL